MALPKQLQKSNTETQEELSQNLKVSMEKKKKKPAAASSYPACQLGEAVHSLQMPLRKKTPHM